MSFFEILDTLLLKPLCLLFEVVYVIADRVIGNPGLSIIVLSLFMNFLVLPLYMRADAIQEEEHAIEKRLQKGVAHIKKTFRGDERMMMLQAYYRQNCYKPAYVLRSAVSLFLQIPFFIAAYRFLSGLQMLNGAAFGPIADLGSPDGMLVVGEMPINVLPVIMTAVNIVSCMIFTKGSPMKAKIQLYAMALFFLIFLYTSPAGLVFYWTLNNVFSLVKTIFYKLKNPRKVLCAVFSAAGILLMVYGFFFYQLVTAKRMVFFGIIGLLMQMPLGYYVFGNRIKWKTGCLNSNSRMFWEGSLFLTVLMGVVIPSAVIKSSPLEFVDITHFYHPLWFIVSSSCMALGIFVIWAGIFYLLAKPSVRAYFELVIWALVGVAIVDYMFFGKNLGILSAQLKYEHELYFTWAGQVWNIVAITAVIVILYIVYKKWRKPATEIMAVGLLALCCMASVNIAGINTSVKSIKEQGTEEIPKLTLSKNGKNVIVFMIDRAMGQYIPYFLQEKPELKELFSGFTYYANTISFGCCTNIGTPPLFGGYEYTPEEMNKRDKESLESKHDEALKVLPVLFDENGYNVVVCDPPYAGYQWIPDLTIYDEYPDIQSYIMTGKFTDPSVKEVKIKNNKRNFICYSIFKTAPLCVQEIIYDKGQYNQADGIDEEVEEADYSGQVIPDLTSAIGLDAEFMESYSVLENLPYITEAATDKENYFLMLQNDTTHKFMMLQEPEYIPQMVVNNAEYENSFGDRFILDGRRLKMDDYLQVTHYQINMGALLRLGKWFDYMRENDVYDNTRIILVADHGYSLDHWDDFYFDEGEEIAYYYPLLMVKDFGSKEFEISEEFMTNGDVPTLAVKDIIEEPINPFTGKVIDTSEKTAHDQYVFTSYKWSIDENNGNTFIPGNWYAVHDDMRSPDNWKLVAEDAILPFMEN